MGIWHINKALIVSNIISRIQHPLIVRREKLILQCKIFALNIQTTVFFPFVNPSMLLLQSSQFKQRKDISVPNRWYASRNDVVKTHKNWGRRGKEFVAALAIKK